MRRNFCDKQEQHAWRPKPDLEEIDGKMVDSSAFNTHDFAKLRPRFDMGSYKMRQLQRHLKDLLLLFTTIEDMPELTYERLRARILKIHDEIKALKVRRQARLRREREAAFGWCDGPAWI